MTGNHRPAGLDLDVVTYNHDVEVALIGAVLLHGPEALDHLADVDVDDFSPDNGHLWAAITEIASHGLRLDPTLLAEELGPIFLERLGGRQALTVRYLDAQASAPVLTSVNKHAEILHRTAQARRLQATAFELATNPINGHVDELVDRLDDLRSDRRTRRLTLTPAADIELGRPHWIWDQRIPVGGVTLMAGKEGDGKTLLVCWLAARISQGQLPGERRHDPCDVIYIGLEDDRSTVIKPRLIAAGADLNRFHFVDLDSDQPFTLDHDLQELADAAAGRRIGLIVIDPLDAHLGNVDSHKKGEVQAAIGRLAVVTQQLRCGALGLAHFNKAGFTELLARINGSKGFSTAVRSVLAVGPHPSDDNDRLCVLAKANMTSKTDVAAVRFRIEGTTIPNPADNTDIDTARVVVLGEEQGHHPDNLLATVTTEERTFTEEATEWLQAILADGPMAKADIAKLARLEGFRDRPLRSAQQRLNVIVERDPTTQGRPSTWRLPIIGEK